MTEINTKTETRNEELLDEYVKITKTIDNIQNKINMFKKTIEGKLETSTNDDEREMYLEEFKTFTLNIKNDTQLIQKYKLLNKKQKELRDQLLLYIMHTNSNPIMTDNGSSLNEATNTELYMNINKNINTNVNINTSTNKNSYLLNENDSKFNNINNIDNVNNDIDKTLCCLRLKYDV